MKRYTPVLFFIAAALFAVNGVIGMAFASSGRRSGALSVVFLALGAAIRRKQATNRA